ncbi:GNAT family N-acetyltransferase [Sphingobacterium haloxyli]|uniref:GNAT family N-acetyltransferase n=1 Tax=Sphingobacterium haloxyli TaxID=2100533 RepID=A0A2S9IY44_9SPHI|nr:GNAT family N-acetyltransferase [Sphingobacterium haloxyli]PRD45445.1 GNAT family N-acetyltransferase [Sphingobacterium haloxyli]
MLQIRQALPTDANAIAPIMLMAMEDIIYYFIGERHQQKAITFLAHQIAQTGNQYSYEHIIVAEEDGSIIGQICLYRGDALEQLRAPILSYLNAHFNRELNFGNETQAGEVYIDTLAVSAAARGKGIGKILLLYAIDLFVYRQKEVLGLLVDKENPKAQKLYLNMGFKPVRDVELFEKELTHLQFSLP